MNLFKKLFRRKQSVLTAKIIRKDGTVVNLGVIAEGKKTKNEVKKF